MGGRQPDPSDADDIEFEQDPRYRVSVREAWICIGYWLSFAALSTGIAWGIAGNRDPAETTYIMGFPDWFFWSGIVLVAVFSTIVPVVLVRFFFTEVDLAARPGEPDRPARTEAGGIR